MNYPWIRIITPGAEELSEPLHPSTPQPSAGTTATLDDRYGRTPGHTRRTRVIGVVAAVAVALVFVVWVIWAGPGQTSHGLDSSDVGYQVVSDHETIVHSQVSVDPGTAARCAVQVLDKSYTIVGWKEIPVPASDERTRNLTTAVKTVSRGVTGLIHDCWVP